MPAIPETRASLLAAATASMRSRQAGRGLPTTAGCGSGNAMLYPSRQHQQPQTERMMSTSTARSMTLKPVASISSASPQSKSSSSSSTSNKSPSSSVSSPSSPISASSLDDLSNLKYFPKLIVLDLDNTLWTPELYQLPRRLKQQNKNSPVANEDIRLFQDVEAILQYLYAYNNNNNINNNNQKQGQRQETSRMLLAVASRTNKVEWANRLLDAFTIQTTMDNDGQRKTKTTKGTTVSLRTLFDYIEIVPGSKKKHFSNLKQQSSLSYSDMLFFDDDARMNLDEVSSQLGVLCCHTPRGLTMEYFVKALQKYNDMKTQQQQQQSAIASSNNWMGYILNAQNLGILNQNSANDAAVGQLCSGRVKFYSPQKKFGFVIDDQTNQEYFVHESKVPAGVQLQTGDDVQFEVLAGGGKPSAVIKSKGRSTKTATITTNAAAASRTTTNGFQTASSSSSAGSDIMSMRCFSMSQPFASLLLNGLKTVESRNNPMFADLPEGTQVLLHCGMRDWHDTESYKAILRSDTTTNDDDKITEESQLPRGYSKGSIVGILTVGKTWRITDRERQSSELQRRVLAPPEGIGKFCTEITQAKWLQQSYKSRGNPGIYDVSIPKNYLPNK